MRGGVPAAWRKLSMLGRVRAGLFKTVVALELGLTDPTCGLNMGQTAERLRRNSTSPAKNRTASRSRAISRTNAWKRGFFKGEVVPLTAAQTGGQDVEADFGPRPNQSLEALQKLPPLFDAKKGTVTAGNSCPISDGAAAVILRLANSITHTEPLGFIRDYAVAGCDPRAWGLVPCSRRTNCCGKPA